MSSGASKVIVLEPDPRAGRLIQLGFEREGVPVLVPPLANGAVELPELAEPPGLVLVGAGESAAAVDLVRRAKAWLAAKAADVPIVVAGRDPARGELTAAGADEVIARPVFLRDIVTIGRLLRGVPRDQRDHLAGSLVETTGVLTLVRALSALGRSAVLTLIRGLRRGEVRFFHGEVTSAQVGLIHGQAALHQLLLWTDARFEFAHEDIVRRQQIPLSPEELFADAEQFLEGVREHSGQLSPSTVLEQNVQRIQQFGKQVPTEVHGILRMFDGHRVLADILEDSPYRVFETLRVTQKAVEIGLLRQVNAQRPKATWRAVLAIEEWLVGNETRDAVAERIASLDSGPVKAPPKKSKHKRKRRGPKKKDSSPPQNELKGDIDWGALVPRMIGAEIGPISGVVPSYEAHGEVELPTRDKPREGLEALMDTAKRQKIFPTEIGLEPSVVIAAEPGDESGEWERAEWKAKQVALAQEKAVAEAKAAAERADAEKRAHAEKRAAEERADAERRAADEQRADASTAAATPKRKRAAVERGDDVILEPAIPTPSEPTNTARHAAPPPPAASDLTEALAAVAASAAAEPVPMPPQAATSNTDRHAAPPPATATAPAASIATSRGNETSRHSVPLRPPAQSPTSGGDAPAPARHPTNGTAATSGDVKSPSDAATLATPAADAAATASTGRAGETARHTVPLRPPASTSTAATMSAAEPAPTSAVEPAPTTAVAPASTSAAATTAAPTTLDAPATTAASATPPAASPAAPPALDAPATTAASATRPAASPAAPLPPVVPSSAGSAAEIDPAAAGLVAVPTYVAPTTSDPVAAVTAVPADATEPRQIRPGATDARELVRGLVSEVVPPSETPVAKDAHIAEPVTVAETPATTVAVTDVVTVSGSGDTAVVTASPRMMISEQPAVAEVASTTPARTAGSAEAPAPSHANAPTATPVSTSPSTASPITHAPPAPATASIDAAHASASRVAAPIEPAFLATSPTAASPTAPTSATAATPPTATVPAARDQAAPEATEDEPSDGVVRATIASADTARVSRARMRPPTPEHDGPPIKQTTGEISQPARQQADEPAVSEPSILVADLAAVHEAAAAAAARPAPAPPPADAATPSRELEVAEVRRDALAFSEAEEAFFRGAEKTGTVTKVESFEDLDEGYQPPGFWDRVFGRKKPK